MKKIRFVVFFALAAIVLLGCKTTAPYKTENVTIDIQVLDVSAGYAVLKASPSKDTYYYGGLVRLEQGESVLPFTDPNHFMTMQLDQAYIDYLEWRHDLLNSGVPYIASFSDHTLWYGSSQNIATHLVPGCSYLFYAFVVDPEQNVPVGDLYYKTFTCKEISDKYVAFDYRIDNEWDFVYPLDASNNIYSTHPYYVSTVSKTHLLDFYNGDTVGVDSLNTPFFYFYLKLATYNYYDTGKGSINYGVYSACHSSEEYAQDSVVFEAGETYYTGIFSADGLNNFNQFQIYKFTWKPGMQQDFYHLTDNIGIHW